MHICIPQWHVLCFYIFPRANYHCFSNSIPGSCCKIKKNPEYPTLCIDKQLMSRPWQVWVDHSSVAGVWSCKPWCPVLQSHLQTEYLLCDDSLLRTQRGTKALQGWDTPRQPPSPCFGFSSICSSIMWLNLPFMLLCHCGWSLKSFRWVVFEKL